MARKPYKSSFSNFRLLDRDSEEDTLPDSIQTDIQHIQMQLQQYSADRRFAILENAIKQEELEQGQIHQKKNYGTIKIL